MRLANKLEALICVFAIAAIGSAQQDTAPASSSTTQSNPPAATVSAPSSTKAPCPATAAAGQSPAQDCKPASSRHKHKKDKHPKSEPPATAAQTNADQGPSKKVVRNGGASDPSMIISPGLSPQQASRKADETNQMLDAAEATAKSASKRQVSDSQQDTVKQVYVLIKQAKDAQSDGDLQRAYNLANKAKMLSNELVPH